MRLPRAQQLACACLLVLALSRQPQPQQQRPTMRYVSMVEATPVQERQVSAATEASREAPDRSVWSAATLVKRTMMINQQRMDQPAQLRASTSAVADAEGSATPPMFKRRRKSDQTSGSEVMQLEDKSNKPGSRSEAKTGSTELGRAGLQFDSSLVRELSDLIMNNEPEMIRRKLTSAQISGQLAEETRRLTGAGLAPFGARQSSNQAFVGEQSPRAEIIMDEMDVEEDDEEDAEDDGEDDDEDNEELARATKAASTTTSTTKADTKRFTRAGSTKKRRHMPFEEPTSRGSFFASPWDWVVSSLKGTKALASNTQQQPHSHSQAQGELANEFSLRSSEVSPSSLDTSSGSGGADSSQEEANSSSVQQQPDEPITCPPDYDESSMMDNVNLNEVIMNGGNLSAEQRQQLNADIAGMLGNTSADQTSTATGHMTQHNHQLGACIPQSARMIEVITKVVTPILFAIIVGVGLIGNIIVIAVIWDEKKQERGEFNATNLLILDLSIADLSFIIFCIPFTGWDYAVGHWVFGLFWCKANQYLIVVCALSSIYTLVLMSCDRYMAIMYPIECINYRNSANMIKAIYIKWAVILVCALPTIEMHGLVESPMGPDLKSCRFLSDQYNPLKFQVIFFISSYFLPLMLIFFLYLGLLRSLWCGRNVRGHKESQKTLGNKRRITRMVASIVIVFASCWCPIQVMLILMRLKSFSITPTYVAIQVFAHTLGYMNSCVNPFIYAFTADCFYKSFKRSRFGRICLSWFCCCRFGSRNSSQPQSLTTHNTNNNANNGINNNSFLHPQNATNVVVHSASSSSGNQCQHQSTSRRSLQLLASTGPNRSDYGTSDKTPAEVDGCRRNNSSGNIMHASEINQEGSTSAADTFAAGTEPPGRMVIDTRERRQPTLEPKDRPQVSKLSTGSRQRQTQATIASSSSTSQLAPNQQIEHCQRTASSSELGSLTNDSQCEPSDKAL